MGKNPVEKSAESHDEAAEKGGGRHLDSEFQEKSHQRSYNPIDEAERGRVCDKLNEDAGRMRHGPYPV